MLVKQTIDNPAYLSRAKHRPKPALVSLVLDLQLGITICGENWGTWVRLGTSCIKMSAQEHSRSVIWLLHYQSGIKAQWNNTSFTRTDHHVYNYDKQVILIEQFVREKPAGTGNRTRYLPSQNWPSHLFWLKSLTTSRFANTKMIKYPSSANNR